MAKNKKSIIKKALKNVKKESATHEKKESKMMEGKEDTIGGMGGPLKKYKNLTKK